MKNVEITFGEEIADLTASRDLKALVTAGFFEPVGDTRGRYYIATDVLKAERTKIRENWQRSPMPDPFEVAAERLQLSLDVSAA